MLEGQSEQSKSSVHFDHKYNLIEHYHQAHIMLSKSLLFKQHSKRQASGHLTLIPSQSLPLLLL